MTEHDTPQEWVRRAAGQVAVAPRSGADLLEAVRRARTRRARRRAVAGGAVLAVLAVVAGGLVVAGRDSASRPAPAQTPATRLVGAGRLAVAVPADWGTDQQRCGQPTAPTVMEASSSVLDCLVVDRVPYVEVYPDPSPFDGALSTGRMEERAVPGGTILVSRHLSYDRAHHRALLWLQQGSTGPALLIGSPDVAQVRAIADTARLLAPSLTAVADDPLAMEGAGLHVQVVPVHARLQDGTVLGSDPPFASVVPAGSTVRVRLVVNHRGRHSLLRTAAGTRPVGSGRLVVPVPATWSTDQQRCGEPTEPTVMQTLTVVETCAYGSGSPYVQLQDTPPAYAHLTQARQQVPGGTITVTTWPRDNRGYDDVWLRDPATGASLLVAATDPALVRRIVAGARILPTGLTTVPASAAAARAAGLRVGRLGGDPTSGPGSRPLLGTVVRVGSTVDYRPVP